MFQKKGPVFELVEKTTEMYSMRVIIIYRKQMNLNLWDPKEISISQKLTLVDPIGLTPILGLIQNYFFWNLEVEEWLHQNLVK